MLVRALPTIRAACRLKAQLNGARRVRGRLARRGAQYFWNAFTHTAPANERLLSRTLDWLPPPLLPVVRRPNQVITFHVMSCRCVHSALVCVCVCVSKHWATSGGAGVVCAPDCRSFACATDATDASDARVARFTCVARISLLRPKQRPSRTRARARRKRQLKNDRYVARDRPRVTRPSIIQFCSRTR